MKTKDVFLLIFNLSIYPLYSQVPTFDLPYSWIEEPIKIAIVGIFKSDEFTKEGYISENDDQFKLLITYENLKNENYQANSSLFQDSPGVGNISILTDKNKIYKPKYTGGSFPSSLRPLEKSTTYLYTFNIKKGEVPVQLLKYNKDYKELLFKIQVTEIIPAPIPVYLKFIKLGTKLQIKSAMLIPKNIYISEFIVDGPFKGSTYGLYTPKYGYNFYVFELEIINTDKRAINSFFYAHDGEFELETEKGNIYKDISSAFTLLDTDIHLYKKVNKNEIKGYPILNSFVYELEPDDSIIVKVAFEIPIETKPKIVSFKLLDDIKIVKVELME